jgi:glycine/D-amino acid oxidase-like deaminating enzyme
VAERNYWTEETPAFDAPVLTGSIQADVAIIGAGLTGLSAVYHLARRGAHPVILEARHPGWGASGRNAGMVVPTVTKLSIADRVARWGPDATRHSGNIAASAVQKVSELIAAEKIDCDVQAGGWLQVADHPAATSGLAAGAQSWQQALGHHDMLALGISDLESRNLLKGANAHGGLYTPNAFGIHPMKYVYGLAQAARHVGAGLYVQSPVTHWDRNNAGHRLTTAGGTLIASRVVVATDAYTPRGLHRFFDGRTVNTTGAILVTSRLSDQEWDRIGIRTGCVYTDLRRVLFYWRRLPDDRLLFGGRGPASTSAASIRIHEGWLEHRLAEKFPELGPVQTEYFWTGNIGLSLDRTPHLGTVSGDHTVGYAMSYSGTGIALATYWGAHLASLMLDNRLARDTPMTAQGLPKFPLPALRRHYVNATRLLFELQDRRARR